MKEFKRINSKGQATQWVTIILALAGGLLTLAIFALVLVKVQAADTDSTFVTIMNNTVLFTKNFTAQFPTIGTIAGVLVLLALVIGGGMFGYSKMKSM